MVKHQSIEAFSDLPEEVRLAALNLMQHLEEGHPFQKAVLGETLRLILGDHSSADMRLMSRLIQEMRKGLEVFQPYQEIRKVGFFGSARISPGDPRYIQVRECTRELKEQGLMVVTGGGGGLMQAANEGAGREHSFGININLPMEQEPNPIVDGSPCHFYCQYFFTRKVFFLKESDALLLAAGGFGTLDETFEALTLLQTGRTPPIPVVLLEAPGDDYWGPFINSWMRRLVEDHLINPGDSHFLFHTDNIEAAVRHITGFYHNYHSFRYVGEQILLRILRPLTEDALHQLNAEFSDVLEKGEIQQLFHWPKHDDSRYWELPRLRMHLDCSRMNVLPQIIQRLNDLCKPEANRPKVMIKR
ncbi:MAG: LOG family protein [Mariprofundaceae bacterium]